MKSLARAWTDEPGTRSSVGLGERLATEMGPLLVFFAGNQAGGIEAGTAAFMAATVVALAAGVARERRVPPTPLVSCLVVVAFGATSLAVHEPWVIMIRPTIMNLVYAGALLGALAMGRLALRSAFGGSLELDGDRAWVVLTLRLAAFLAFLAALNEIVWRTQPVDVWVAFKTFAVLPMNLTFLAAQAPFVRRHRARPQARPGG